MEKNTKDSKGDSLKKNIRTKKFQISGATFCVNL